jgi:hypothetical protein
MDEREARGENGQSMMLELAEQVEDHYTQPSPAARPRPNYFPEPLPQGLLWGLLVGALVGVAVAWLLHSGRVTPAGWEGLFSLVPVSFYAFFAFAGAAAGMMVGGVATLMATQAPQPDLAAAKPARGVAAQEAAGAVASER